MKSYYSTDWFILNFIACPNCNGKLIPKPVANELRNVFCENCDFSCRFETAFNHPNESILNIPYGDLDKLISNKKTLPPFIIDYKWKQDEIEFEKIYFFPFIALRFLKEEQKRPIQLLPNEKENSVFYSNMFELPHILLFEQPSIEDMAEIASKWQNITTSYIQRRFGTGYVKASMIKRLVLQIRRKKGIVDEVIEDIDEDEDDDEDGEENEWIPY